MVDDNVTQSGRYKAYPEYKDSGVEWLGKIPSDWELIRLKNVLSIRNGRDYKANELEIGGYPVYGSGGIFKRSSSYLYNGQSILFGRKGTIDKPLLVSGKFWTVDTMFYSEIHNNVIPEYVFYQALSFPFDLLATNTAVPSMTQEDLVNLDFILPLIKEQKKIIRFLDYQLDKIDTLIEKQQRLIELLTEKRQAVISHAVTKGLNPDVPMKASGVEWLGQVPAHWEVSKLKFESEIIDCRNKTPEYFENGEYFVVRTTNVKNQNLNFNDALYTDEKNFKIWTQRGVPPSGSILFTREAPTGEVCIVPSDLKFCMGQRMMNFIAYDKNYTSYLFDYLISDCLDRYINGVSLGSTVSHLRVEQVQNIPVLVPPKDEIEEIHSHIESFKIVFDDMESKATMAIRLMQERRTALISSAVTGKIDVRDWVKPE